MVHLGDRDLEADNEETPAAAADIGHDVLRRHHARRMPQLPGFRARIRSNMADERIAPTEVARPTPDMAPVTDVDCANAKFRVSDPPARLESKTQVKASFGRPSFMKALAWAKDDNRQRNFLNE
jgi:hypothetical protein